MTAPQVLTLLSVIFLVVGVIALGATNGGLLALMLLAIGVVLLVAMLVVRMSNRP